MLLGTLVVCTQNWLIASLLYFKSQAIAASASC
jgi:hypothetical protein